ncbi:MAG TPA: GNAT family N-acetyltransferase [Gaiellaceae bacterium]|jgi:GNAT superfamily N-acetyltransferase
MISVGPVETGADFEAWAKLKSTVVPNEPVTVEQLRLSAEPDRKLVLAELDGVLAGCGIADRSSFGGRAFIAVRVLAQHRRHGVGSALLRELGDYARSLGLTGVNAFVYADEPHSIAFVEHLGLLEVDYQLEQVRVIGDETAPLAGLELVPITGRREELLTAVWPVAIEAYEDLPLPGEVTYTLEEWLRDEGTREEGSFVAFENGDIVGWAGLNVHANGNATAEHGLTAVRRDRRGHGIGRALKRTQLHWAAQNGVVELVTWTQRGNEAMQALNRSLGYIDTSKVITYQGPLP